MAKDLIFRLRLDERDKRRLEEVAASYLAPAATTVRMLIKKEYDRLQRERERAWLTDEG